MKVAILGAFGGMGEAALADLAGQNGIERILAVDVSLARSRRVLSSIPQRRKITPIQADLAEIASTKRKLKGSIVLVNCAWYEHNLKAMDLALALKAHYVDLGGLYHMTLRQLKHSREFEKAGLLAVLGCGSTPGITNMMAVRLAASFDLVHTARIYDASFDPALSETTFLPPFSIKTLLAEYEAPAWILKNGRMKALPAHSLPEEIDCLAPIGRVKTAAVLHSEAATLPAYLRDKGIKNLSFKIHYPDALKRQLELLKGLGLTEDRPLRVNGSGTFSSRNLLAALARQNAVVAPAAASKDFEILRVTLEGRELGSKLVKTLDCYMRPASRTLSAGAAGVGFTAAIAAGLIARGQVLKSSGVAAPETALSPEIFFKELKARKIFSFVETISHKVALP